MSSESGGPALRPRIVVGVDGSPGSLDAISLGTRLRAPLDADLLLAFAGPGRSGPAGLVRNDYDAVLGQLARAASPSSRGRDHVEAAREIRIVGGETPVATLHRLAVSEHAGMLVVGSSRRSGMGRVRPGATAERLLTGSPCPVAVAPRGYANRPSRRLRTVAVGFDGSPESEIAVDWAASIAVELDAKLRLVAVHERTAFDASALGPPFGIASVDAALRDELSRVLDRRLAAFCGVRAHGRVVDGDPAQWLTAASADVDLLVTGSRGYGPVRSVLLGSVSTAVMRDAACPVVVVPRGALAHARDDGQAVWAAADSGSA